MILFLACAEPPTPAPTVPAPTPAPTPAVEPAATAPDLVLFGVAGLRADVPSGAGRSFAAAFDGRATAVFEAAYAQSTSRFTSWGSVLAGRYPSAIPLCGVPTGAQTRAPPWCNTFPEAQPSLPEVLALYGYRTALLAADLPGVEHLDRLFQDVVAVDRTTLDAAARAWWEADASRPRLLVIATADLVVQERPALLEATGLAGVGNGRADTDRAYRAFADEAGRVGREVVGLLDALPASRPRWAFAFGVHGQRLGDTVAPWQALGDTQPWSDVLLERSLHVPLVVVGPTPAALRETRLVELVDLVPTLTRLAGAVPPAALPGSDLLSPEASLPAYAYAEFGDMLAVRTERQLYSVRGFFHNRSSLDPELTNFLLEPSVDDNKHFLHDVERDPLQGQNLVRTDPEGARRMHALLASIRRGAGAPPPDAVDARRMFDLRMRPSEGYW